MAYRLHSSLNGGILKRLLGLRGHASMLLPTYLEALKQVRKMGESIYIFCVLSALRRTSDSLLQHPLLATQQRQAVLLYLETGLKSSFALFEKSPFLSGSISGRRPAP